ncbi:MAG TPA: CPBP family glutamic-type intramembrane protease [Spirillospora sp.]|nr:CPBP family glutamic-type intramembrane protease [Spirillospora sp.]
MSVPDDTLPEYDDYDELYDEEIVEEPDKDDFTDSTGPLGYRAAGSDPTFGYLIALALAVGLTALPPEQRDLRYTILWMIPAGFGVMAWLLGSQIRIQAETPENLAWGIAFALIVATPLLAVGGSTLTATVNLLFRGMTWGTLLAYMVFVMPLAETLFFRGLLQLERPFWIVGLMSSLWSALLFFPLLNIGSYPAIAAVITVALLMMNLTYSYVRQRNGLAAAWVCQIVVNLVLIFFPYVSS